MEVPISSSGDSTVDPTAIIIMALEQKNTYRDMHAYSCPDKYNYYSTSKKYGKRTIINRLYVSCNERLPTSQAFILFTINTHSINFFSMIIGSS